MQNTPSTEQPELSVELWAIGRLAPFENNPRICPAAAVEKVAASIREFGFRNPCLVTADGVIIAGHTRVKAAQKLGLTDVPVIVCADLDDARAKALRIADNRSQEETSWDFELLADEIGALVAIDYDLSVLGFDPDELAGILATATLGRSDPDLLPAPPAEPISRAGDLWQLGKHRLLCGDATNAADVARLMGGERASVMATDWPYGVGYDGGNHPQTWAADGRPISGEEKTKHWDDYSEPGSLLELYEGTLHNAVELALAPRAVIYTFFAMTQAPIVFAAWEAEGLLPHQVIIWHKSRRVLGRSDYAYDYEPCVYGWVRGMRPLPARRPPAGTAAVWTIASAIEDGASGIHPTQKPVELIRRPIGYHTLPGELIYEPFSGSGTAIIAAEMSGRRCYALEISPAFVDVAVTRWQNFTGKEAVRHVAGE
jgi:DNA modification methylase